MLDRNNEVVPIPQELLDILANTPDKEVIATIEALNPAPEWKADLVPWRCCMDDEPIPWEMVYCLYQTPLTDDELIWITQTAKEMGWID